MSVSFILAWGRGGGVEGLCDIDDEGGKKKKKKKKKKKEGELCQGLLLVDVL